MWSKWSANIKVWQGNHKIEKREFRQREFVKRRLPRGQNREHASTDYRARINSTSYR